MPLARRPAPPVQPAMAPTPRALRARDLLAGERAVCIEHAGERYVLRLTRQNKLLLTK